MLSTGARAPFKPPRPFSSSQEGSQGTSSQESDRNQHKAQNNRVDQVTPSDANNVNKRQKLVPTSKVIEKDSKESTKRHYFVQWRKFTTKKNKTWEDDGLMVLEPTGDVMLFNKIETKNAKMLAKASKCTLGDVIKIGSYEATIDHEISDIEVQNGPKEVTSTTPDTQKPIASSVNTRFKSVYPSGRRLENSIKTYKVRSSLYTVNEDSLVMSKPPDLAPNKVVDVVVDPILSKHLRPHQRDAVCFLYDCVMGFKKFGGNGALLADEMGLGKTLTTIAVIWTLLKQNPYLEVDSPVCRKVLITCPVSLIQNWSKEFKKWLGLNRIGILALNSKQNAADDKVQISSFGKTRVYQVMIISYEKVLTCRKELMDLNIDLLVCDEGHRLKSATNKVMQTLNQMQIKSKILLTGTPIQNDLYEFYNIVNFINPGVLGTPSHFQKEFVKPISRARDMNCTNKVILDFGEEKSNELLTLTRQFVLRRSSSVLSHVLPDKTDIIIFCPPSNLQLLMFKAIQSSQAFNSFLQSQTSVNNSLGIITVMKKLCNSPSLLANDKLFNEIIKSCPEPKIDLESLHKRYSSGKVNLLIPLLLEICQLKEKIVLISNYTQTLDLFENVLRKLNISFLRLDGSTQGKSRDSIVNEFNNSTFEKASVFLLSAKSGGFGLNLIGASRLILFDNDWNPSVDLQAMARIHRDGQKKPVFIYRLFTTGCIDEKIFQRQLMKQKLSEKFVDNKEGSQLDLFDINDLKDIFTIHYETKCNTHDLLQCSCEGIGEEITLSAQYEDFCNERSASDWVSALELKQTQSPKKNASIRNALEGYKHFDPEKTNEIIEDPAIDNIVSKTEGAPKLFTFMFSKKSTSQ
ncbi:Piso0_002634 [Millerozyma farinosa CBS 7064]|uniref:Piso0_002634 protein n=1 Tax=Pichia sorbitophila (strain ATCC MYA-4447 / BCRC 22081 / CBS 7064 / NBRC 10061 / NRRL Y-12695) TaxID=559304 RepID=G8YFK1_PICSO|nr:Piso0_002634 [Millerozyma farinosa CBS 7064]